MPLTPTDLRGSAGATGPAGPAGPAGPPGPPGAPQTPSSATPQPIGTAAAGSSTDYARGDHVHSGALADLSDVASTAPSSGQVLTWGGADWAPATPAAGVSPSSATPQPIGTAAAGSSTDYARGDHVHSAAVTALSDRFEALPLQNRAQFAAAGWRDIQAAIDAHTTGDAAVILAAPGSYPGATVTIGTGKNNFAVCGAAGQPYGGTITSLSAGRGLTVSGSATRIRIQNLQIEGLTTWATSGAGVHRVDRCQLVGGLIVSGFAPAQQLIVTDCEISGAITIPAGFLGVLIFDHCTFSSGWTLTNGATAAQLIIANSTGVNASSAYTLQGWISNTSNQVAGYANGAAVITPALAALGATAPATNRIPYYNSSSTATTAPLSATGRDLLTLSSGSAGQVLTSSGSGVSPVWAAASGGSGLPTSQSWTVEFAPTSTSGATLSASGFTLVNLTSGGLFADVWGNVYELLTPTGIGYFYPTALTPTSTIPWEIEFDALFAGTTLDGVFGLSVNEESGAKRWRMFYSTAGNAFQHVNNLNSASNLSTPHDVQGNQRIIMGVQSEPRSSRAFYANGQCIALVNPDSNQAASGTIPQIYAFGNTSGSASTTPIRVYRARVLHNGRGTAPPYARQPWPPQQP